MRKDICILRGCFSAAEFSDGFCGGSGSQLFPETAKTSQAPAPCVIVCLRGGARAYPDGEKLSGIPADFPFSAEHGNDFPVLRVARKKAVSGGLGGILSAGRRDGGNA